MPNIIPCSRFRGFPGIYLISYFVTNARRREACCWRSNIIKQLSHKFVFEKIYLVIVLVRYKAEWILLVRKIYGIRIEEEYFVWVASLVFITCYSTRGYPCLNDEDTTMHNLYVIDDTILVKTLLGFLLKPSCFEMSVKDSEKHKHNLINEF